MGAGSTAKLLASGAGEASPDGVPQPGPVIPIGRTLWPFSSTPTILSVASLGITWFIVGMGNQGTSVSAQSQRAPLVDQLRLVNQEYRLLAKQNVRTASTWARLRELNERRLELVIAIVDLDRLEGGAIVA